METRHQPKIIANSNALASSYGTPSSFAVAASAHDPVIKNKLGSHSSRPVAITKLCACEMLQDVWFDAMRCW